MKQVMALIAPPVLEEWERLFEQYQKLERAKREYALHAGRVVKGFRRNQRKIEAKIMQLDLARGVAFATKGDLGIFPHGDERWSQYLLRISRLEFAAPPDAPAPGSDVQPEHRVLQ